MIPCAQRYTFRAYPMNLMKHFNLSQKKKDCLHFSPTLTTGKMRLLMHLNRAWGNRRDQNKATPLFHPVPILATPIPNQTRPVANNDNFLLGGKTGEARLISHQPTCFYWSSSADAGSMVTKGRLLGYRYHTYKGRKCNKNKL